MRGRIFTEVGWTAEELDATPYAIVAELLRYWESHPPVHLMLRAYLGIDESYRPLGETPSTEDKFFGDDDLPPEAKRLAPPISEAPLEIQRIFAHFQATRMTGKTNG